MDSFRKSQALDTNKKRRLRTIPRLDLNLISSIYSNTDSIPSLLLPSTNKIIDSRWKEVFDRNDKIKNLFELTDNLCLFGYKLDLDEENAMFYKMEYHATYNIPQITKTITLDKS